MPTDWEWDATLFRGAARHYVRGRLPYPARLADCFREAAALDGAPRLIDVGCGPGIIAIGLAGAFAEVIGVDPDADMLREAADQAAAANVRNVRWVNARAEELPAGLDRFRYATFGRSFHWMDRDAVAAAVFELLEPGGAFVHVNSTVPDPPPAPPLPFPMPPREAIERLIVSYLGAERRAGQGVLPAGTPHGEADVLARAGYRPARTVIVEGREVLDRSVDDVVAWVFSRSRSAPHLFGPRLGDFERELRALLEDAADDGRFSEWLGDVALDFYERPHT